MHLLVSSNHISVFSNNFKQKQLRSLYCILLTEDFAFNCDINITE